MPFGRGRHHGGGMGMRHRGWRGHHQHYQSRFGSNLCCCIMLIICAGPILIISAIATAVMGMKDSRNPRIEAYNAKVDEWVDPTTKGAWKDFHTTAMQAAFTYSQAPQTVILPQSTTDTKINDNGATGDDEPIEQYSNFVSLAKGTTSFDLTSQCNWQNGCQTGNYGSFVLTIGGQAGQTVNLPAIKRSSTSSYNRDDCADNGNFWDYGTCYSYSVLKSICAKVASTGSGQPWNTDNSYGGYGCGQNSAWTVGTYKKLSIYTVSDFPSVISVPIEIRATTDPRVQFYDIVGGGSTDFGYSQAFLLSVAVGLFVVGGSCSIGLIFCCICIKKTVSPDAQPSATTTTTTYQQFNPAVPAQPQQPAAAQPYVPQAAPVYQQPQQQYPPLQPQQGGYPPQQQYQAPPQQQAAYPAPDGLPAYPPPQ